MDAETKEYLDLKLGEILTTLNAGFSRLEQRLDAQAALARNHAALARSRAALERSRAAARRDRPWERIHR